MCRLELCTAHYEEMKNEIWNNSMYVFQVMIKKQS